MFKRWAISVVGLFIASMVIDFLVHGMVLAPRYAQLPNLFRQGQDAQNYFPYMLLAHVFLVIGFVWIYVKGREDKPFLVQGIRYGAAVAVLTVIPTYLIYYAVQPMPGMPVFQQIVLGTIGVVLMGIIVAWLNR